MPDALIRIENLDYVRDGKTLLHIPLLAFKGAGTSVILGPNGAGKSLLLRMMMGLIEPDQGAVIRPDNLYQQMAWVPQKPVLLRRSVLANLTHALAIFGTPKAERQKKAEALLDLAALSGFEDNAARKLSGGEQQRLALVRALAQEPKILFLDEATAHLDPESTQLIETIVENVKTKGTKIVVITHDHGQAKRLADEVIFVRKGRILEQTAAEQFFTRPQTKEAQAFLEGGLVL